MSPRAFLRKTVPHAVRASLAGARRSLLDARSGKGLRFARRLPAAGGEFAFPVVTIVQEIKPSPFLAGKLANLRLGSAKLDGIVIAPGETFSFWRLVGKPSARAGFALGRSIRGGVAGGDIGGGLCQLSGIVYEAGIRAGLDPVERHPHSRDLYEEQERFTPLGLDATVVWPWKDLRLHNPLAVPIRLRVAVRGLTLHAELHAPAPIGAAEIQIDRQDGGDVRQVRVMCRTHGAVHVLSDDLYALPDKDVEPQS